MRICSILKVYKNGETENIYLLETERFGRKECMFSNTAMICPKKDNITIYDSIYQALNTLDKLVDFGILKRFSILKVSNASE